MIPYEGRKRRQKSDEILRPQSSAEQPEQPSRGTGTRATTRNMHPRKRKPAAADQYRPISCFALNFIFDTSITAQIKQEKHICNKNQQTMYGERSIHKRATREKKACRVNMKTNHPYPCPRQTPRPQVTNGRPSKTLKQVTASHEFDMEKEGMVTC